MFSWFKDFRGKQRIEDLRVRLEDLAAEVEGERSCSDALYSAYSEVSGRHDCMKALLEEKVFPALEKLEAQGACEERVRLDFAAELSDMFVDDEVVDADPDGWL